MTFQSLSASAIVAVLFLVPSAAVACEGHAKEAQATIAPAPKPAALEPSSADAVNALEDALLKEVDVLVADKCSCGNAADCTCRKGQCKCKSCKPRRMVEPVKGTSDALQLPKEARYEATSGVFI